MQLTCRLARWVGLTWQALLPGAHRGAAGGAHKAVEHIQQGVPTRHCRPKHCILAVQQLLQAVAATP